MKQLAFTRYTKYLDQCLKDLDDAREYKTDQLAIQLVHIQQLTEKIFHFHSSDSPVYEQLGSPEPSTMARLEAFRVELDSLRNALPPNLKSDCMIPQIFENVAAGASLTQTESQTFYLAITIVLTSGSLSLYWQVHTYQMPNLNPSPRSRFQACRYPMSSHISLPRSRPGSRIGLPSRSAPTSTCLSPPTSSWSMAP